MPKKLGQNTKSVEAKARKEAQKQAKLEITEKLKEEELWKEDDKHVLRKLNRKEEKEKKKQELADRKAVNKAVYEEEMSSLKSKKSSEEKVSKVTRSEIKEFIEKQTLEKQSVKKDLSHDETPIEDNINRIEIEGEVATDISEAIALLSTKETELDRHPEKRLKAAYNAFEESNLPRLKLENPNLRLSQLKQLLKKDWMKSPENPLNQRTISYNSKV